RIADPSARPLLVHCAAGKDRTGFVCAMLQHALGVPADTIMEDYLATRERYTYERLVNSRLLVILHMQVLPPHAEQALRVLSSVQPEFLETAYERIRQDYGGIDAYLETQCGLSDQRR